MLCERCQAFDVQTFSRDKYPFRGYPVEAVVRATQDGCSFCALLEEHLLQRRWTTSLPPWIHFWVEREEVADTNALGIRVIRASVSESPLFLLLSADHNALKIHVAADSNTPASSSGDITGNLLGYHALSEGTEKFILDWHRNCYQHHPDCSKTLSQSESIDVERSQLPSRCIETVWVPAPQAASTSPGPSDSSIGDVTSGGRWVHCLRVTTGERNKYIALSHRWDSSTEKARTVHGNYLSRTMPGEDSSLTDTLSPLFREVCIFAARLGVFLVWIDSICIVQDDADDWRHEATQMARYYQFAWLTIAMTSVSDSGGGLHAYPRAEDIPRVARLPYRAKDAKQHGWFYAQCIKPDALNIEYDARVAQSELLRRGWVFQEWLLSRRILSIGATTVFLQCEGDLPMSPPGEILRPRHESEDPDDSVKRVSYKRDMSLKDASVWKILKLWRMVVEDYSAKRLTKYEQDRFIALSGVAREFGLALRAQAKKHHEYDSFDLDPPATAATIIRSGSRHGNTDDGEEIELPTLGPGFDTDGNERHCTNPVSSEGESTTGDVMSLRRSQLKLPSQYQYDADEEVESLLSADRSQLLRCNLNESVAQCSQGIEAVKSVRYVCGLWLPFNILSQLQWEQVGPGPRSRVRGIPTWSWASIGTSTGEHASSPLDPFPVTWPTSESVISFTTDYDFSDDSESAAVDAALSVPVNETTWEPQFDQISEDRWGHGDAVDDSRFVVLSITNTALLPVHINATFNSLEHIDVAARMTGHRGENIDRSGWRSVSLLTTPHTIAGWASLEDPEFQIDNQVHFVAGGTTDDVYALVLDEVNLWDWLEDSSALFTGDGLGRYLSFLGFGAWSVSTIRILFVRATGDRSPLPLYERIGVGRLFGPTVKTEIEKLERTTVLLR